MAEEQSVEKVGGQTCPMCFKKTLTLMEQHKEVPYFGGIFIFSMTCSNCKFHKTDVEAAEEHEPARYTIEVNCEDDMKIRIVKSSQATIKIPHITTVTPGPASNGYVTNVEGVLNRIKAAVETAKNDADEKADRKKAKNMLKKLTKVIWGQDKLKIIIEDPTGNSAIISDKAQKVKMRT